MLEPGRSLVSRAGVTLYTVGVVKQASAATTYVTIDGGMSDNPRPAMYNARYTALLANRADEAPDRCVYAVAGKHCESGDVLIERVELPEPRRGDLLAVPVTGAYTLSMSSTYNAVPRPPAVLVADGKARADPPARDGRRPARARGLVLDDGLNPDFPQVIQETVDSLPADLRERISNLEIVVEDEPPPGQPLLGLYQGIPLTRRGINYSGALPDKISIYRGPLERHYGHDPELLDESDQARGAARDRAPLRDQRRASRRARPLLEGAPGAREMNRPWPCAFVHVRPVNREVHVKPRVPPRPAVGERRRRSGVSRASYMIPPVQSTSPRFVSDSVKPCQSRPVGGAMHLACSAFE